MSVHGVPDCSLQLFLPADGGVRRQPGFGLGRLGGRGAPHRALLVARRGRTHAHAGNGHRRQEAGQGRGRGRGQGQSMSVGNVQTAIHDSATTQFLNPRVRISIRNQSKVGLGS